MQNIFTLAGMHGIEVRAVIELAPGCFYTQYLTYIDNDGVQHPTAEELAEYPDPPEGMFGEEQAEWEFLGCYDSAEAAVHAARLSHWAGCIHDDLRAFHAPSECYSDAYRPLEREVEAHEAAHSVPVPKHLRTPANPWLERGLEDRSRPIAESLPNGGCGMSDHDIIAALGERPAL